jgi:hypothetical protein
MSSTAYHDEDFKLIWLQNKRPAVYESGAFYGYNCHCTERVPKESIIRNKSKMDRKEGHNQK